MKTLERYQRPKIMEVSNSGTVWEEQKIVSKERDLTHEENKVYDQIVYTGRDYWLDEGGFFWRYAREIDLY